ncbi:unnamed protein product [Peronospora farinosa]|uniref:RRM Nup35-type domain-containing protein n=1 Tax=Peronospora farinosa TaxID=134698 RepID=A0ABN8C0K5_9STRA|nr:unnamed protein product [Peronospora farinosa]
MSPLSSRTTSTAQEDEYFPSFLTALQSTPKADKSKESTPHSRSETSLLFSNGKPRLTFAESLSMNRNKQQSVEMPEDSPFNFGGSYQDKLGTRRRKNASSQGATNSNNTQDEDILPPPTMSLLDPVGFAAGSHNVDDDEAAAMAAAARRSAAVQPSYYPNVHAERFQAVGEVVNYSSSTGGNWLHLRYHTRLQAEKALGYDGRTLANNIMVGVKKCYSSDRDANALNETPTSSYFGAQARQSLGSRNVEVDPTDADIMLPPRRQQDMCSRLLNYLFNW